MHHENLINFLVAGFVVAFALGMLANRLRLSPLVGYLVAGILVGPFTPGFVADGELAPQLAEIGVILLMFGVGLHFSPRDLMQVRVVAIPGAIAQTSAATVLGWAFGRFLLGVGDVEGLLLGFSLSVASTVVLLRALEERRQVKTEVGRIAVGWLIVEDLVVVVALVMIPLLFSQSEAPTNVDLAVDIGLTLLKVGVFIGLMLFVGGKAIPWMFVRIARTRSRELFTLGVLAVALGIAWLAYEVFGASFALGAFVAGLTMNGTDLGHKAAERSLPLQDAFAVLFFVSVGMLFDPTILVRQPLEVAAVVVIIIVGKAVAALAITKSFRLDKRTGYTVAASLSQIGEFSFILAALCVNLGVMSSTTQDLVLAGALLSISLNPFVFMLVDRIAGPPPAAPAKEPAEIPPPAGADIPTADPVRS